MPRVSDLKSSKFLKKEDVEQQVLVTIKKYEEMNVAMENQAPEMKWALYFNELDKPLILNQTNGMMIEVITGSDNFDDWIGKQIVLFDDPNVMFGGKMVGGIRVRMAKTATAETQTGDNIPF